MRITLRTRVHEDIVIVNASGKLTLGENTSQFRELMQRLAQAGRTRILLNLEGVTRMDSTAIGELVAAYSAIAGAGGEMKLLGLDRRANDLLTITKLHSVFEVFENEPEAIRSFSPLAPSCLLDECGSSETFASVFKSLAISRFRAKRLNSPTQ